MSILEQSQISQLFSNHFHSSNCIVHFYTKITPRSLNFTPPIKTPEHYITQNITNNLYQLFNCLPEPYTFAGKKRKTLDTKFNYLVLDAKS